MRRHRGCEVDHTTRESGKAQTEPNFARSDVQDCTFRRADQSYRPKNSLAAGLIISGLHIGSKVSWAFTVSTPSMESVSVSTCSWIKSPTGHIGLVRLKVTSTWRPSSCTPTS